MELEYYPKYSNSGTRTEGVTIAMTETSHLSDIQMGCSAVDKAECNNTMKGESNHFECYCRADYCNGVTILAAGNGVTVMLVAAAVAVAVMMGRSG